MPDKRCSECKIFERALANEKVLTQRLMNGLRTIQDDAATVLYGFSKRSKETAHLPVTNRPTRDTLPQAVLDRVLELTGGNRELATRPHCPSVLMEVDIDGRREMRPCLYLGVAVRPDGNGALPQADDLARFHQLISNLVKGGYVLGYLLDVHFIELKEDEDGRRGILVSYLFLTLTQEELNERVGCELSFEEGGMPGDVWPIWKLDRGA